jgi:aminopeptidase N
MITQCQQYGFQRMVPSIDAMWAKTYYTTSIIADRRYTNIITNGDLASGYFDPLTSLPLPQAHGDDEDGNPRVKVVYHNHITNMAPYLFFLGCGTYVTYRKRCKYPSGVECMLEILVFPGLVEPRHAKIAIDALHRSILWTNVCTGPEQYEHKAERKKMLEHLKRRERLVERKMGGSVQCSDTKLQPLIACTKRWSDADEKQLQALDATLQKLASQWTKMGYQYTGAVGVVTISALRLLFLSRSAFQSKLWCWSNVVLLGVPRDCNGKQQLRGNGKRWEYNHHFVEVTLILCHLGAV